MQYVSCDCFRGFLEAGKIDNLAWRDILARKTETSHTRLTAAPAGESSVIHRKVTHCHGHQDHNVVIATDSGQK